MSTARPLPPPDDTTGNTARAEVRGLVSQIQPGDKLEYRHRQEVLAWIDGGAPLHRLVKPATPPMHLVSYCLVIDPDARSALLVDHRDAGRWLPAGGHVEPDEHPVKAARRELHEELALQLDLWPGAGEAPFFLTSTVTEGHHPGHTDVSLWFVFQACEDIPHRADPREFLGTRWWPLDDIIHRPTTRFDPHLPRFVAKFDNAAQPASP